MLWQSFHININSLPPSSWEESQLILLLKISLAIVVCVGFEIVSIGIRNLKIGIRLSLDMKEPYPSWKKRWVARTGGLTRYNPHQIARETDSLGAFAIDSIKGGVVSSLFRTAFSWELNELSRHEVKGRAVACSLETCYLDTIMKGNTSVDFLTAIMIATAYIAVTFPAARVSRCPLCAWSCSIVRSDNINSGTPVFRFAMIGSCERCDCHQIVHISGKTHFVIRN